MSQESESISDNIDDLRERVLQGEVTFTSKDISLLLRMMELYKSLIPVAENVERVKQNQERLVAVLPQALENVNFPKSKSSDYFWLACNLSRVNNARTEAFMKVHNLLLEIIRNEIKLGNAP